MSTPFILALDFDGVVCDGLIEYFETSKRTYTQIWSEDSLLSDENLAKSFYALRPVIETGWEMPLLVRALVLGYTEHQILQEWPVIAEKLLESEKLEKKQISQMLDLTRDKWIVSDLEGWLGLQRLYPGIAQKLEDLMNSPIILYIISTKEGRFIKKLLQEVGVEINEKFICGKEVKQPKHETLRQLIKAAGCVPQDVWFVEDRFKTLESVKKEPDLNGIGLFLASWGYNTEQAREAARYDQNIHLVTLEQFLQDFSLWQSN